MCLAICTCCPSIDEIVNTIVVVVQVVVGVVVAVVVDVCIYFLCTRTQITYVSAAVTKERTKGLERSGDLCRNLGPGHFGHFGQKM